MLLINVLFIHLIVGVQCRYFAQQSRERLLKDDETHTAEEEGRTPTDVVVNEPNRSSQPSHRVNVQSTLGKGKHADPIDKKTINHHGDKYSEPKDTGLLSDKQSIPVFLPPKDTVGEADQPIDKPTRVSIDNTSPREVKIINTGAVVNNLPTTMKPTEDHRETKDYRDNAPRERVSLSENVPRTQQIYSLMHEESRYDKKINEEKSIPKIDTSKPTMNTVEVKTTVEVQEKTVLSENPTSTVPTVPVRDIVAVVVTPTVPLEDVQKNEPPSEEPQRTEEKHDADTMPTENHDSVSDGVPVLEPEKHEMDHVLDVNKHGADPVLDVGKHGADRVLDADRNNVKEKLFDEIDDTELEIKLSAAHDDDRDELKKVAQPQAEGKDWNQADNKKSDDEIRKPNNVAILKSEELNPKLNFDDFVKASEHEANVVPGTKVPSGIDAHFDEKPMIYSRTSSEDESMEEPCTTGSAPAGDMEEVMPTEKEWSLDVTSTSTTTPAPRRKLGEEVKHGGDAGDSTGTELPPSPSTVFSPPKEDAKNMIRPTLEQPTIPPFYANLLKALYCSVGNCRLAIPGRSTTPRPLRDTAKWTIRKRSGFIPSTRMKCRCRFSGQEYLVNLEEAENLVRDAGVLFQLLTFHNGNEPVN